MFSHLEEILLTYSQTLSLELFVFFASIVEEVLAPIPSPTVMVVSGSLASIQGYALIALIPLAVIGAIGKVLGALVVYYIADKGEDVVLTKFGKYFGVTHEEVEKFGTKIGKGFRNYIVMTVLRALPFVPSVVVSVGSGVLKVPLPVFVVSTFFGTIVRDGFYLYAGYVGLDILRRIIEGSNNMEFYVELAVAFAVLIFVVMRYKKRTNKYE